MKYRTKPIVIDAIQLPKTTPLASDESARGHALVWLFLEGCPWKIANSSGEIDIETSAGTTMTAKLGDWIIKDAKGAIYTYKPNIFEAIYEKVED